jgi:hypothetical protein
VSPSSKRQHAVAFGAHLIHATCTHICIDLRRQTAGLAERNPAAETDQSAASAQVDETTDDANCANEFMLQTPDTFALVFVVASIDAVICYVSAR